MSAGYISGYQKVDIAILPQSPTAQTAVCSRPYLMSKYHNAIFIVSAGSAGNLTGSTSAQIWGRLLAGLSTSTGSFVPVYAASSFSAFMMGTSNLDVVSNAVAVVINAGSSPRNGESITIWGASSGSGNAITYTVSTAISSTGYFSTGLLLAASSDPIANAYMLAQMINDSTVGVPGLRANMTTTNYYFELRAQEAGEAIVNVSISVTAAGSSGSIRQTILEQVGYLAFNMNDLLGSCSGATSTGQANYKYVMLELTASSAFLVSAFLLRQSARYSPTQFVSGSKVGGSTA